MIRNMNNSDTKQELYHETGGCAASFQVHEVPGKDYLLGCITYHDFLCGDLDTYESAFRSFLEYLESNQQAHLPTRLLVNMGSPPRRILTSLAGRQFLRTQVRMSRELRERLARVIPRSAFIVTSPVCRTLLTLFFKFIRPVNKYKVLSSVEKGLAFLHER